MDGVTVTGLSCYSFQSVLYLVNAEPVCNSFMCCNR